MLVLSRNVGERVFIDDEKIVVTILEILPNKVRLGFEAPREIGIVREEVLFDRRVAEVKEARAHGLPIHNISDRLDALENQGAP